MNFQIFFFLLFYFFNSKGNQNCPVSNLGQFHWNWFKFWVSFTETVPWNCYWFLNKKCKKANCQKLHRNYLEKKGPFWQKTKVKEQFHEKTAFNFLFYCATVSVENWQIKMALFVSFLLSVWTETEHTKKNKRSFLIKL